MQLAYGNFMQNEIKSMQNQITHVVAIFNQLSCFTQSHFTQISYFTFHISMNNLKIDPNLGVFGLMVLFLKVSILNSSHFV